MSDRKPWTFEELRKAIPRRLKEIETEYPDARPISPLNSEECIDLLTNLFAAGTERPLTNEEVFLAGQLMAQMRMAVTAEALGYKGRFYVVTDQQVVQIINRGGQDAGSN